MACERSADYFAKAGRKDLAKEQRQQATWWRRLETLSAAEADQLNDDLFLKAIDCIDAFTALAAKGHDNALDYLVLLASGVFDTLLEFAADGHKHASDGLMALLCEAVGNFEFLATNRPELFRERARQSVAIPGLISRGKAQARDNDRLLKSLEQGEDSYLAPSLKKRRGQFWKFSNYNVLAVRLVSHVEKAKAFYEIDKNLAKHVGRELPMWRKQAAELKPFSAITCRTWANVIWQVIAEASPQKKPGLNPAFYDPKAKISKVRTTRINPYYKTEEKAFSIAEQDIKEALFNAIELIGTGESRRTKQRKVKANK